MGIDTTANTKVYLEIVKQIRTIIEEDGLHPGDKIPSERELTVRLKKGRSSIREALRALELLGLIETRRGEGTYIKNFGNHQLVHLLGTFILQGNNTKKNDLIETKSIIERDCIVLACERMSQEQIISLLDKIDKGELTEELLFESIVRATNNSLLLRIWIIVSEYYRFYKSNPPQPLKSESCIEMLTAIKENDRVRALKAYGKVKVEI